MRTQFRSSSQGFSSLHLLARPLFLAALLCAARAPAQSNVMGSLSGVVLDAATQQPIAGAVVVARSPELPGEQSVSTDDTGSFEMTFLPSGSYSLSIRHNGYEPFAPDGLSIHGQHVRVKLQLLHEKAAEAPPPPAVKIPAVEFTDAMTPPTVISGPDPEYTEDAIDRGVQGLMVVKCVVAVEGRVHNCKVIKGLPFMDSPVLESLAQRRYKPAMLAGKPVEVYYTFNIRLKLPR